MTSANKSHFDVVVIGAGPAGSTCSALLAQRGMSVLLVDKASFPRDKICGDCINPKCWEIFDLLGVSDEIRLNGELVNDIKIADVSGEIISIPIVARLNEPGRPFVAMKRSVLDTVLLKRAIQNGVIFMESTSLESLHRTNRGFSAWNVGMRSSEGKNIVVTGRHLVAADGRNSRVASLLLGADLKAEISSISRRIGVQFMINRPSQIGSSVVMFFFEGGYGGIVAVNNEEANIAMAVTPELSRLVTDDFQEFVAKTLGNNQHTRSFASKVEALGKISTSFPITPGPKRIDSPGMIYLGDAKQTVEPFTGEGVFYAMQDGVRGAEEISRSFGFSQSAERLGSRSRFRVNSVFSTLLQRPGLSQPLLRFAARHNRVAQTISKVVLG